MNENISGMNIIILVWIGFGGVGFSLVCRNIDVVMMIGSKLMGMLK